MNITKWLNELKEEIENVEQRNIVITDNKVKKQYRKMPNWKAPGNYGVQGVLDKETR